ncbi:MAG: hypothetical protein A2505_03210 [Deltaproteobacteria bacterium RIFOXYD12_FULL_55_16]|nr:MAG: hypothetical protein A2505_03210 [Deltaproteobacteria bacterium RIFOXYD12_FULL_55_16]
MSEALRLLLLEDSPTDAELNERTLRRAGLEFTALRVETMAAFTAALDEFKPDLILADYHLPGFDGIAALAIAQKTAPEIPFIFVTGAMGEGRAVETIKQGAIDYILKDRLGRLPAAVQRALEEKALRAQKREDEAALRRSEASLNEAQHLAQIGSWELDLAHDRLLWSAETYRIFEIDPAAFGATYADFLDAIHPDDRDFVDHAYTSSLSDNQPYDIVHRLLLPDGRVKYVNERCNTQFDAAGQPLRSLGTVQDITKRQAAENEIKHLNRTLRTISSCNQNLVHARSEADLLQAICRDIVEVGGYILAWVAVEAPAGMNTPLAWYGNQAVHQTHAKLDNDPKHLRHCLVSAALSSRRTQVCNQLNTTPECDFSELSELGVQSILSMPLLNDGQLHGALTIFSTQPNTFDTAEVTLMEELAADLAYGLAALRMSKERDLYLRHFEQAMQSTVKVMARTLEMRDPYTAGHQQRVTALALAIAKEMALDLDPTQIEGLKFGGMIHDIGKISVPAEILSKPGKLTAIEFQLIQQHPETGHQIVADIDFPWPMAQMIVQHHERLDGSGYPAGLKGEEIMLEARILAVADVVEAMSSHRPYRASLGMEAALAEIERGSGLQYDAAVAAACLKVVRGNGMRLPE